MEREKPAGRSKKLVIVTVTSIIVVLLGLGFLGIFLWNHRPSDKVSGAASTESQTIIDEVGKLYALPLGDPPTVALIQEVAKLQKDQNFYKPAKNGDYVLVFAKSRMAMLYRPSLHKLVFVSQVNTVNPADKGAPQKSVPAGSMQPGQSH